MLLSVEYRHPDSIAAIRSRIVRPLKRRGHYVSPHALMEYPSYDIWHRWATDWIQSTRGLSAADPAVTWLESASLYVLTTDQRGVLWLDGVHRALYMTVEQDAVLIDGCGLWYDGRWCGFERYWSDQYDTVEHIEAYQYRHSQTGVGSGANYRALRESVLAGLPVESIRRVVYYTEVETQGVYQPVQCTLPYNADFYNPI